MVAFAAPFTLAYDPNGNNTSISAAGSGLPVIVTQPVDAWASAQDGVGLSVVVSSGSPVSYQWKKSPGGTPVNGATSDSLFFSSLQAADEGAYQVTVTNSTGSVTSAAARLMIDGNGNKLPDSWELAYFGNLDQSGAADYDADGVSNANEYLLGTNPTVNPVVPAINYWKASSGDFGTAANWTLNKVPGAGETAVINQGTFTLPTTANGATVVVNIPYEPIANEFLRLSATGRWRFNGLFRPANGTTFTVTGSGGQATVAGPTFLNDSGLKVESGTTLTMEAVTNYAHPGSRAVQWTVEDMGSRLVFPYLQTLAGTDVSTNYFSLKATRGTISLPELREITVPLNDSASNVGGIRLDAQANGVISAPKLARFEDLSPAPNSYLYTYSGGRIDAPLMLAPVGLSEITLGESSDPFRFTSLTKVASFTISYGSGTQRTSQLATISGNTKMTITDGVRASFPRLLSVNPFTQLDVTDGANVSFDAVQSYEGPPESAIVKWTAANTGTVLSFPELTTITGPSVGSAYLQITAQSGARILMPRLQVITKASDGSSTVHSRVILQSSSAGSLIYAPALYIFSDNDVTPRSEIDQASGSTIFLGRLSQQGVRGVTLSGVTLPSSSPIPELSIARSGTNWRVSVPALSGKSYLLRKSASLGSGSWSSVGSSVAGSGDWLDFTVPQDGTKSFFRVEVTP